MQTSLPALVFMALLLAGCVSQRGPTATAAAPGTQPATPAATVAKAQPAASPQASGTASVDLTQALSRSQCPITALTDYEACDGAFCIRTSDTVVRLNERHKILWLPQSPYTKPLTVRAARYGGGPLLRQTVFDSTSPPEPDYPSTWQFPEAGCWRLEAEAGEMRGSVTVWVESGP